MSKKSLVPEMEALNQVIAALTELDNDEHRRWVLETASNRFSIKIAPPTGRTGQPEPNGRTGENGTAYEGSPKGFVRKKDPKNDVQRVACLAYYLTNYRDLAHFKSQDLSVLNTEAAGPRINISRAVNNAMIQNHYLAAAGGGQKQITSLGEEVVKALPDQEAVKALEHKGRPKRRKKREAATRSKK